MTKFFASDEAVERIGAGLLDRTLPKAEWTHAAHFAAALWLLRRHGEADAAQRMPGLIRAYNEAVGVANTDTEGYHETITQASIREAARCLAGRPPAESLHEVVDHLMASPLGDRDWLLAYWSKDRLFSVAARRAWLGPDLSPLPQA